MTLFSPLAIAPMIDWTHTHFRVLMRLLAPRALLYTEMQTPGAIAHRPQRSLYFSPMEKPVALQLGGSDSQAVLIAAQQGWAAGYDEINLNLGCPSDRVQAGRFGACLMAEPKLVHSILRTLKDALPIPISAKTRIGIDHQDDYPFFENFVDHLVDAGCDKLIVHARKAWLSGLSPKQNRSIPPVLYDYVYQIKQRYPDLPVVINGNIRDIVSIQRHLTQVDGVMLGRLAYQQPYTLVHIHQTLYPDIPVLTRAEVVQRYCEYAQSLQEDRPPLSIVLKPLYGLAHGLPNAGVWKQALMKLQATGDYNCLREFDLTAIQSLNGELF